MHEHRLKTTFRERIYVAMPYSAPTPEGIQKNVDAAALVAARIWERGHEAFCPHTASHYVDLTLKRLGVSVPYNAWIEHDIGILRIWPTSIYFETSPGADRELRVANLLGLKVYQSINDIPWHAR